MISFVSDQKAQMPVKRYSFADCILDLGSHTLTRAGHTVSVEPKVFDLLCVLLENAGNLVSRDKLIEDVWQRRIVSESAISACISAARRAVGDDGKTQAIIRTVARRGFTCIASVTQEEERVRTSSNNKLSPRLLFTKNRAQKSLAYVISGSGPPVLFTTFGGTSIEADWSSPFFRPLFDAIGTRNTLIRHDGIGSGQSDLKMTSAGVEAVAEDMLSVADAAGLDRFSLFCQSGSALSAVYLASPEK